jgi:hypothetical protein
MSKVSKLALIFVAPLPGAPQEAARETDPGPDWIAESREWLYRSP